MSKEKNNGLDNWRKMTPEERKQHVKNLEREILDKLLEKNPDAYKMFTELKKAPQKNKIQWAKGFISTSPRAKIKSKCLDCSGFNKENIRYCVVKTCPLWEMRPYK